MNTTDRLQQEKHESSEVITEERALRSADLTWPLRIISLFFALRPTVHLLVSLPLSFSVPPHLGLALRLRCCSIFIILLKSALPCHR